MRILALALLAGFAVAQAPSNFQPVGNMSQLMIDIIYPASDALFYIERDPPKNDHDWNVIRGNALMVAESGNLLLMGYRARDQDRWVKDAKLMIDAGAAAFRAAQKKDMQAILALGDQLTASCITCHKDYRANYGK
jgi:cytochrome c553